MQTSFQLTCLYYKNVFFKGIVITDVGLGSFLLSSSLEGIGMGVVWEGLDSLEDSVAAGDKLEHSGSCMVRQL